MKASLSMLLYLCGIFAVTYLPAATKAQTNAIPKRTMNVTRGPETVFTADVTGILPGLKGAVATRENGRVGNELVFWGYRLANGDPAYLYACAPVEGVDCVRRRQMICPVETHVISQTDQSGQISHFQCKALCGVHGIEVLACCQELMQQHSLMVGLVKCQ